MFSVQGDGHPAMNGIYYLVGLTYEYSSRVDALPRLVVPVPIQSSERKLWCFTGSEAIWLFAILLRFPLEKSTGRD